MNTNRSNRFRWLLALAAAGFGVVQLLLWAFPGIFETWNSQIVDRFFLVRAHIPAFRPRYDPTVVHVDLNNKSLRRLGTFYPNRFHYAREIRNLAAMGAAAQVYDVIFSAETAPADDLALIGAAGEAGNVYFGMAFSLVSPEEGRSAAPAGRDERIAPDVLAYLDRTLWKIRVEGDASEIYTGQSPLVTFPRLASDSKGIGFLSLHNDRDGVTRRMPLLVRYGNAFYPGLALRVVCDYLGVPPDRITLAPGRFLRLAGAHRPGGPPHDIVIPIDRRGDMIINFMGPWGAMRHYDFADIHAASDDREELGLWRDELAGKIVVVSEVSTGATDIGTVPVDTNYPLSGLHANVIHTILTENFLTEAPPAVSLLVEICLVLLIFLMSLRLSPMPFFAGSVLLVALYGAAALGMFLAAGVLLRVVGPAVSAAAAASFTMAWRYFQDEKEKEALRRSFESYFPPPVVRRILANPAIIAGGQRKELTILFSDIKDFTHHSSCAPPDRIRGFLNDYFESMVEIVFTQEGTVDKYMGDGLMVFFGDPEPMPDHALRAVRAAVAMQEKARELNGKWIESGFPVQIRIGINTGEVVVGNMGSSRRLSYTVLGAPVNLAKRLESSAPTGGILISQRTFELLGSEVPARFFGKIKVKGIEEPVSTYEIVPEEGESTKKSIDSP